MQNNSLEETRKWIEDFDAQVSNCPVEMRRLEKVRAEELRQAKIIKLAEAHAREQRAAVDNREGWERFVDERVERQLDFHFGYVQDGELVGGVLHGAIGEFTADWVRKKTAPLVQQIEVLQQKIEILHEREAAKQTAVDDRAAWERLAVERIIHAVVGELIAQERERRHDEMKAVLAEQARDYEARIAALEARIEALLPSKLRVAKTYEAGKVFYRGDVVVSSAGTFQATCDSAADLTHADWICLARAGRDGSDGASLTARGVFDTKVAYRALDVVEFEKGSYIACRDDPGPIFGDGWQVLAVRGKNGDRGPPGPRGERGEQGERGESGERGFPGPRGELGDKGERGENGLPGPPGEQGLPGPRGQTGAIGQRGENGLPGPRGAKGERGFDGLPGRDGAAGPTGEKGDSGREGPRGPKGDRGFQGPAGESIIGPAGPAGAKGEKGDPGGCGLDGLPGRDGPTGPLGPRGERGFDGEAGAKGEKGDRGEAGLAGPTGPRGEQGERGICGREGIAGPRGERGEKGDVGPSGERGAEGPPGRLPVVKAFEAGRVHYQGDVVTHGGSLYQAVRDTARGMPHADWICLARAGRDALSPNVRGTYDTSQIYQRLDIVALDGASFIAKRDDPGICPGEGWQLIAAHGARGEKGSAGLRGDRGDKGERGEAGVSIVGWHLDRERYRVSPRMSDGSVGDSLELRGLFEQFLIERGD